MSIASISRSLLVVFAVCVLTLRLSGQNNAVNQADNKGGAATSVNSASKESTPAKTISGSIEIAGNTINYDCNIGKITLDKEDGSPRASLFYVAYERNGIDSPAKRPVMFAFNGGPGSSSVWLHIGALGPRVLQLTGDGTQAPAVPTRMRDNPLSILDACDLVFIDPVSTGYSRTEKDVKPEEFHGVNEDIASVADFIRTWVNSNRRWASPKFVLGESYGGIRAAGLAQELQDEYGMSLNGVILLSSLLDFQTLSPSPGNDLAYPLFLPTYTATALHHGVIKGDAEQLMMQAREFAMGEYSTALLKGYDLDEPSKLKIAQQLNKFTGLSIESIMAQNLRIDPLRFRGEILKNQSKTIGRFDARVSWPDTDPSDDHAEYDPSYSLAYGAFATAMMDYLSRELNWQEKQPYTILSGKVHPWRWSASNEYLNVAPRLAQAMRDNPKLQVLVQSGNLDLATPSDGMAHSLRHMPGLSEEQRKQIHVCFYQAGHMFYLNPPDMKKMRNDLLEFIKNSQTK